MTEGVKKWSTEGREPQGGFKPVPPGKRTLKLIADKIEEAKDKNGNPYIKGLRLQDVTDSEKGGSSVFATLFLGCVPKEEGGISSVEYKGALLDLIKNGLRTNVEFDTTEDGKAINPDAVLEFLKNNDGQTVTAQIYARKQAGRPDEAAVRQFLTE